MWIISTTNSCAASSVTIIYHTTTESPSWHQFISFSHLPTEIGTIIIPIWQRNKLRHREVPLFSLWASATPHPPPLKGCSVDYSEGSNVSAVKSVTQGHCCCQEAASVPSTPPSGYVSCLLTAGGALGSLSFLVTLELLCPCSTGSSPIRGPHLIYPCGLSTWTSPGVWQESTLFTLLCSQSWRTPSKETLLSIYQDPLVICASYPHPCPAQPGPNWRPGSFLTPSLPHRTCPWAWGQAVLGTPLHLQEPFWLPPPWLFWELPNQKTSCLENT